MTPSRPTWTFEGRRREHFRHHRRELRVRTLEEYDLSAYATIDVGTYFEFIDGRTQEPRVGYYDRWTRRLTILSSDERFIHSHFRCPVHYVERLAGSTYI